MKRPINAKSYFAASHKVPPIGLQNNRIFKKLQKLRGLIMSWGNPYKHRIENVIHSFLDKFVADNSNSMVLTDYQMECMQFSICDYAPRQVEEVPFFHY